MHRHKQLNEHSEPDAYAVPGMDYILNQLRAAKYISSAFRITHSQATFQRALDSVIGQKMEPFAYEMGTP